MITITPTIEVWYILEYSCIGDDDWYRDGTATFDTYKTAKEAAVRGGTEGYEYRVVRQTITSEVIATVKIEVTEVADAERIESCPKCGKQVARKDAFEDEGEGPEAGRTFYYCSDHCRSTH